MVTWLAIAVSVVTGRNSMPSMSRNGSRSAKRTKRPGSSDGSPEGSRYALIARAYKGEVSNHPWGDESADAVASVEVVLRLALLLTLVFATPAGAAPMAFGGPTGRVALDSGWRVGGHMVTVPYSPNAKRLSSMRSYRGSVARFSREFAVAGGDYAIRFESVQHRATVWLDGRLVARHTGAYLTFEVRAPLKAGRHRLVVRADWRDPDRMRDEGWFRSWFNFGGLNREVTIRRLGASELDAPAVDARLRGPARLTEAAAGPAPPDGPRVVADVTVT